MHSGISAPGSVNGDWPCGNASERIRDLLLNGWFAGLYLPALIFRAVVGDSHQIIHSQSFTFDIFCEKRM
jgi:hypothetical protein